MCASFPARLPAQPLSANEKIKDMCRMTAPPQPWGGYHRSNRSNTRDNAPPSASAGRL
jgi:hypothetical protein